VTWDRAKAPLTRAFHLENLTLISEIKPDHHNNLGFLRLAFAMCVLVSHSIELVDGNASREPMTYMFGGSTTLGGLGVSGFFLISGYLIAQSFENSPSFTSYLSKRVLRIYPAFIIAFFASFLIVGPLSGADLSAIDRIGWLKQLMHIFLLDSPSLPKTFMGLHSQALNGPMWTIAYEFRCYLLLAVVGYLGLLRQKQALLAVLLIIMLATMAYDVFSPNHSIYVFGIDSKQTLRLTALFIAGSIFYAYRDIFTFRSRSAFASAFFLIMFLFIPLAQDTAIIIFGGYLVFWLAFAKKMPDLTTINVDPDISYGIYLYAWPVQQLLIKSIPGVSPISVMFLTSVMVAPLAFLSWILIEKPSLKLKRLGILNGHSNA
jgi:peptidoglycan/LPS O-acetylase OafA/YrhL